MDNLNTEIVVTKSEPGTPKEDTTRTSHSEIDIEFPNIKIENFEELEITHQPAGIKCF